MMFQAGLARFDVKTETFRLFPVQSDINIDTTQQSLLTPSHWRADGKVWTNDVRKQDILRLDVATGRYEVIDPFKLSPKGRQHSPYGMVSDAANNLYFMDFGDENVGRIDARSGETRLFETPTPNSAPRRGSMDAQDRLWFGEYRADRIGMFDTRTEQFREWQVWPKWSAPYDVITDKNGDAWTGSMLSDRVTRLNPATGEAISYLLPRSTNIRRVFVDNSTTPVSFWVGNNHGASIVKVEPLR